MILLGAILALLTTAASATRFSVDVRNYEFSPSTITSVQIGDTIHWEWKEGSHTTTSTTIPSGASAWDRNLTSSQTTYDYIPTVAGTYNYVCTPHATMGMVGSFVVMPVSGIGNASSSVALTVSPNPFTSKVTVGLAADSQRKIESLRIYDITGKFLTEQSFAIDLAGSSREVNVTGLPAGLLLFEFRDNLGNIYTRRMIKK